MAALPPLRKGIISAPDLPNTFIAIAVLSTPSGIFENLSARSTNTLSAVLILPSESFTDIPNALNDANCSAEPTEASPRALFSFTIAPVKPSILTPAKSATNANPVKDSTDIPAF